MVVDKIISLEKYKEDSSPSSSGECKCLSCGNKWVGVTPIGVIWMECPSCGLIRGRFIHHHERDGSKWVCNCGNDLFYITPKGCYCPNCGDWQKGF